MGIAVGPQNDLCPSCPQLHEESLEKQTLELKEAEQRPIAQFIENLLLLFVCERHGFVAFPNLPVSMSNVFPFLDG